MISISQQVKKVLEEDQEALMVLNKGFLNFSSYARMIQPQVEELCLKDVKEKSITVALSRIAKEFKKDQRLEPPINIKNISMHSNLAELTYERTQETMQKINRIINDLEIDAKNYLALTRGISEITIIGDQKIIQSFKSKLNQINPIFEKSDLTGVTASFPEEMISIPNVIYRITQKMAVKKINIIEIISTFTELTFIIEKNNSALAIEQLTS
jgi:aspartokinase